MKNRTFKVVGVVLLLLVFIALILTPLHKRPPVKKLRRPAGRIAIVIDDWGYTLNNLPIIEQIKQPLTCAILPNLKNSVPVMQKLNKLGFEIMLHLPMEPKEQYQLEPDTITSSMGANQINKILDMDLASVYLAKGVNNHMGSRVTEDSKVSAMVMNAVKNRKLYFLDSFVTNKSACPALARSIKVRFAKRDVFLDNQNDFEYIKGQLIKLKNLARRQGAAIGIGHDRKGTLLALKEMLPQLEKEGYKFVFLSQVVR